MDFSAFVETMIERVTKDAYIYGASKRHIKDIGPFIREAYVRLLS